MFDVHRCCRSSTSERVRYHYCIIDEFDFYCIIDAKNANALTSIIRAWVDAVPEPSWPQDGILNILQ